MAKLSPDAAEEFLAPGLPSVTTTLAHFSQNPFAIPVNCQLCTGALAGRIVMAMLSAVQPTMEPDEVSMMVAENILGVVEEVLPQAAISTMTCSLL